MYVPNHYSNTNQDEAIAFIQRFNFGTLITNIENVPVATHLPFVVLQKEQKLILQAHMARANPHWQSIKPQRNLVIFSEPHAYISPKHYNKKENVPTWNYMAVHAYGFGKTIEAGKALLHLMERAMTEFEDSYLEQWETLPQAYKEKMLKGIVGFEIVVDDLQFKEKLSQNKKAEEKARVADALSKSKDGNAQQIADYMRLRS